MACGVGSSVGRAPAMYSKQVVVGSNPTPRPELINPRFKKAPVKWLTRGAMLEKENREGQP